MWQKTYKIKYCFLGRPNSSMHDEMKKRARTHFLTHVSIWRFFGCERRCDDDIYLSSNISLWHSHVGSKINRLRLMWKKHVFFYFLILDFFIIFKVNRNLGDSGWIVDFQLNSVLFMTEKFHAPKKCSFLTIKI